MMSFIILLIIISIDRNITTVSLSHLLRSVHERKISSTSILVSVRQTMTPLAPYPPHSPPPLSKLPPNSPITVFFIGISGSSSAGKTTLAHSVARVLTSHVQQLLILHGEDFCKDLSRLLLHNTSDGGSCPDADGPNSVDFWEN